MLAWVNAPLGVLTKKPPLQQNKWMVVHDVDYLSHKRGGLTGASVPLYGGIVLSVEKMNKILEIDKDNLVAVVGSCDK